ncbi:MAG: hypothetical protein L0229_25455 [Blastocatellia bacterium]|nr:hypothetical protein [Blastocatellia bacterium]
MNRKQIPFLCLLLIVLASCENKFEPVKTSLGDLVKVEKKQEVVTDSQSAGTIKPKSGRALYVLSFEGKSEVPYETGSDDYYPLLDSSGQKFPPIFLGSPSADGRLLGKDVKLNGQSTGKDGRFVFKGTATLPGPKAAFVYEVPETAEGLALKDGDQKFSIEQ